MEERRLVAATLLRQGQLSQADIARHVGVSRASVCRWAATLAHEGPRGLAARANLGPPARLDEKAWTRLSRLLDRGAIAAGFATERWTLRRLAALIERVFGVHYHPRYLERPLKAHAFSLQRPATRAKERDELVIAGATARGGRWSARHFRTSVTSRTVISALRYFRRRIGTPLLVVWDRLNAHRSQVTTTFIAAHPRDYAVAYLSAYAPELNPEEQCNALVKRAME